MSDSPMKVMLADGSGVMTIYDKLVRDKIPDLIQAQGLEVMGYCVKGPTKRKHLLWTKLNEEILELRETPNVEEMADVLEVLYALMKAYNITMDEVEEAMLAKREERGAYSKFYILGGTIERHEGASQEVDEDEESEDDDDGN